MSNKQTGKESYPDENEQEEWVAMTPSFIQFKEAGQTLIGRMGPSDTIMVSGTETTRYTVETEEGPMAFLGGVQLDSLLMGLILGTKIKLVFLGLEKPVTGGREYKRFELFTVKGG